MVVNQVPVIRGTLKLAEFFGHKLSAGFGAETAGGMLVFLDSKKEEAFCEFLAKKNLPCWPVGEVVKAKGSPCASLAQDVQFIETEFP